MVGREMSDRVPRSAETSHFEIEKLLREYLDHMPAVIVARAEAQDLGRINERDHLQPWSRDWLRDNLPQESGIQLRTGAKLDFPEHFPRVGGVDIVLGAPGALPAYLELKCGASHDALGDCAWDVMKLGVCISQGACSMGYLVAATLERGFDEGRVGTELLASGEWSATGIRADYASWFRAYEKRGDPEPRLVPASGKTTLIGSTKFTIDEADWNIRVARVEVTDHENYAWKALLNPPIDD